MPAPTMTIADPSWTLKADHIDPANYFGITVANGMLGLVSDAKPLHVREVVLNGVYDRYQRGRVSNILQGFNPADIRLAIDDHLVEDAEYTDYSQELDMRYGILHTRLTVPGKVNIHHQLLALRHLPYSFLSIVEIEALDDVRISPMSLLQAPPHLRNIRQTYAEIDRPHVLLPLCSSIAESPTGRHTLAASNSYLFPGGMDDMPRLIHEEWDDNMHLVKFHRKLEAGSKYRFAVVGSTCTSEHYVDPQNEAERLTVFAKLEGIDWLLTRHKAAWDELWKRDIQIEGDPQVQLEVRSMLYHLYSFVRPGTGYSLSPVGLSGLGYNGHVFWDTELWMYPPMLMMQPDIAKSILDYRFERREAARQNAFAHGYKGLMFPWESADDGSEQTPVWALTGPFQHHITGCIGWAFWKYYQVTQDKKWLAEYGYPLLEEVATFWVDRVDRNGPGKYEIVNVIGANEWEENIDNNAFTNGMAQTVLRYAARAARTLGLEPNPDWEHVADNIPILKFPDGTTRENATYEGGEIKQADVNLLAFPLEVIRDEAQVRKDLAFYGPRMSPEGPAMGVATLATLHARLGEADKAYELFIKSFRPNGVPPFGVMAECAGGKGVSPYFITGAGGALQTVLGGFAGLEMTDEGIQQLPSKLPGHWTSLRITGIGPDGGDFVVEREG